MTTARGDGTHTAALATTDVHLAALLHLHPQARRIHGSERHSQYCRTSLRSACTVSQRDRSPVLLQPAARLGISPRRRQTDSSTHASLKPSATGWAAGRAKSGALGLGRCARHLHSVAEPRGVGKLAIPPLER